MARTVLSVAVNLDPSQYLTGWRQETGSLFIPTLSESRVGDEVAVRIGIYGQAIRATLFGKIALVRRVGRPSLPPGAELSLDKGSLPAPQFLAMAARGEPVTFRERAPRYSAERTVVLVHRGEEREAATINVSDGGLSARWEGPLPEVGAVVGMKLGGGLFGASGRAVVCWTTGGGALPPAIGLRLVPEGRLVRAWRKVVAEVAASGARFA